MTDKTIAKKEKALELLKEMDIYKPYIRGFRESDKVCFFENFGGFWLHQEPEIDRKRQEIEAKYNCLVYAVTHEFTPFGECWSFLIVSDYKSEWKTFMWSEGNKHTAFAYVWNKNLRFVIMPVLYQKRDPDVKASLYKFTDCGEKFLN